MTPPATAISGFARIGSWLRLVALSVAGAALVLLLGNTQGAAVLIAAGLLSCYGIALLNASTYLSQVWNPVTIFFSFAVMHAILGYYSASPTTVYLIRPGSNIYGTFEQSFLIASVGLASIMAGFVVGIRRRTPPVLTRILQRLETVDITQMSHRARVLVLIALPAIAYVFWQVGEIPILADNPGRARFLQFLRPEFQRVAWIQNRCVDIFQVAVPCLLIRFIGGKRSVLDVILIGLGLFSGISVVQRGPVISIIVTVALVQLTGKKLKTLFLLSPVFLGLYLTTQYLITRWQGGFGLRMALELYGQGLPEIRDLAWYLSSAGERLLWGKTFLGTLIPLPSFLTDVQQAMKLRNVTFDAIGLPLDAPNGGIRILFAGECYANFGYAGVIVLCFLYGLCCAAIAVAFRYFENVKPRPQGALFVLGSLWVLLSFWLYLGGTNISGMIRFQLILLVALLWRLKPRGQETREG